MTFSTLRSLLWAMPFMLPVALSAQTTDTTIVLPEFSLREKRLHYFSAGNHTQRLDSAMLYRNPSAGLEQVLGSNTAIMIDAYGVGSASISARGMGPKRTPIVWNGFNLQSVTGHDVDASAIPIALIDKAYVETGSQSALFGSGAAGGVVYIESDANQPNQPKTQATMGLGSFGKYMAMANARFGAANYNGAVKMCTDKAINDFAYEADYIDTKTKTTTHIDTVQTNATKRQFGVMSDNNFKIGEYQHIGINLWFQEVDRQIAPTVKDIAQKKNSDATQYDEYYRNSAHWGYRKEKLEVAARTGYFVTETDYAKPSANSNSNSRSESWQSEAEATYRIVPSLSVNGGIHYTHETAKSTSYNKQHFRNREALFMSVRYLSLIQTKITANGRLEKMADTHAEPTFTLGAEQPIWSGLSATAKFGTSYRVPTFNDLYWVSASAMGNPNLKPEQGNNLEGGLTWKSNGKSVRFDAAVLAYSMHMKNWMSWGMNSEDVYTVLNQDSANIKGIESHFNLMVGNSSANISLQGAYTYNDARDPKTNNYLPYVPMHKGSVTFAANYHGNCCWISPMQASEMQTNAANTSQLEGYKTINAGISKRIAFGTNQLVISAVANNLTNTQYQTRQYYPMPGRSLMLSATVNVL